ncbi:mitochondrial ribosomal protein of the large subunit [Myxozyma melibiosi]|uniref:Mitochondrial ribosomal protein of the large subunit n=1 Tax=Myxozyma melibiosi TaxID=54550 RepID=A0ABR1F941_9ASCO
MAFVRPTIGLTALQQTSAAAVRSLHSSAPLLRAPVSIVDPVHHRIRYKKTILHPKYQKMLTTPKWDPRSHLFKPCDLHPRRLLKHWENTLAPDLMLANYVHNEVRIRGRKHQEWDGSSPYHVNRPKRAPAGNAEATPDILPRTFENVPNLTAIWVNTFNHGAVVDHQERNIPAMVMLQQITGKKPKPAYSGASVLQWKLRKGRQVGAVVKLTGADMDQFMSTLVEIVLPRVKNFAGIANSSGDKFGNISFGLTPESLYLFPELEGNPDLWTDVVGVNITFVTSAQTDPEARLMLSSFGIPFYGRERFHNVPSLTGAKQTRKKGIVYYENSQE